MGVKTNNEANITIDKLVHGGQGLGLLPDGRKCFVWGALPGEEVKVQITKSKKDWAEGYASEIIKPSKFRIKPIEPDTYLATSPWQILNYQKEALYKQEILAEAFKREQIMVNWADFYQDIQDFGYRNKMEYCFWYDNETTKVSLALHKRGTHTKIPLASTALASEPINMAGTKLIDYINEQKIEARPLKSVIIRSDSSGNVGISLFVNDETIAPKFNKFAVQGVSLEVVYSNPKSPASVATKVLVPNNIPLIDSLLGKDFKYTTRSFFQVNIPVYQKVLQIIKNETCDDLNVSILDLYSGVGSIGLSVVGDNQKLTMIESSQECTEQAKQNMYGRDNCQVITATSESALQYLNDMATVIIDPPRAGLHKKVTERLIETKPQKIIYLSCNPSTQARDVKELLNAGYKIMYAQGFNFFPRTPHIENLIILQ